MPFWTYMLHCRDRTFYVGHTDDLEIRIAQHEQGTLLGYTARKRPVTLIWSAEFPTRYEALEAERRIKGWRREKKLALIRGDWDLISELAKGRGRPSTGSGRTAEGIAPEPLNPVRPELVEGRPLYLLRHPQSDSLTVGSIQVSLTRAPQSLHLKYLLSGDVSELTIPAQARPDRRDNLWQHTCFEVFIRNADGSYLEFNFSPSTEWAGYSFEAYRTGMSSIEAEPPQIAVCRTSRDLRLDVGIPVPPLGPETNLNLTAVVEEKSGHKSYWALAHPPEGPPDFHHPACFVLELPPPA